jgi:hypothetical protein
MKTLLLLTALIFPFAVVAKTQESEVYYQPGDADLSGTICLADSVLIIYHLWRDGRELPCRETADVDRNGSIGVEDVIGGLRHIFHGDVIPDCPITCAEQDDNDELYYTE